MAETPRRFVRVPDDVWDAAKRRASAQNRNMSEVVRALLTAYAHGVAGPSGPKLSDHL